MARSGTSSSGWRRKRTGTPAELARRAEYTSPGYRAVSRALAAEVERGAGYCWRCGRWLDPHARGRRGERLWHVGHDDQDRSVIRGAECRDCNLRAAARKGNRMSRKTTAPDLPVTQVRL
jgi:hypothetical protein